MVFNVTPNRRETKEDAAFTNVSPTEDYFFERVSRPPNRVIYICAESESMGTLFSCQICVPFNNYFFCAQIF